MTRSRASITTLPASPLPKVVTASAAPLINSTWVALMRMSPAVPVVPVTRALTAPALRSCRSNRTVSPALITISPTVPAPLVAIKLLSIETSLRASKYTAPPCPPCPRALIPRSSPVTKILLPSPVTKMLPPARFALGWYWLVNSTNPFGAAMTTSPTVISALEGAAKISGTVGCSCSLKKISVAGLNPEGFSSGISPSASGATPARTSKVG